MAYSNATLDDQVWKYPVPQQGKWEKEGMLTVSHQPSHKIHYEVYGNPDGEPALFFHGGPGASCSSKDARFFDPDRYRIILFDQRGCGKSVPTIGTDLEGALAGNNTTKLIGDVRTIRKELGITGKMHMGGGSWGSTLALAVAFDQPENIASLTLRGLFLGGKINTDWFNQKHAAEHNGNDILAFHTNAHPLLIKTWREYVDFIPPMEREDMVKAYHVRLTGNDPVLRNEAARRLLYLEDAAAFANPDPALLPAEDYVDVNPNMPTLEMHYFMNGCFLGGKSGEEAREGDFFMKNIENLAGIAQINIIHGRNDFVCDVTDADLFSAALRRIGVDTRLVITDAGHARTERENAKAFIDCTDTLPRIEKKSREIPRTGRVAGMGGG